ncbi:MAG: MFS transporter [Burkholderiales bacterium]|jgi:predicted MFS family arabinose efflux permease|nr:MFS transporter [Burkholderiales bacterium]
MSSSVRISAFAPFRVRSFRFQWPADLATSWAFEMETLILGWYVLVETQSVLMLTIYASLQYVGTLLAPMFGVMGDRVGHRNVLCAMRAMYAVLATLLMSLAFMDAVTPMIVLAIAAMLGLMRPSDIGMRTALVGETMPPSQLMGAMSIQRTTQDTARIAGALTGASLVAMLGMGSAYVAVVCFYVISLVLTWQAGNKQAGGEHPPSAVKASGVQRASPWRELREGLTYVWHAPQLRATMLFAFLLNLTAFPLFTGLMPYVAKVVYGADQTTLGTMVASAATGALIGSVIMTRFGGLFRPARAMIVFGIAWLAMLLLFVQTQSPATGIPMLMVAGCMQTMCLIPNNALLLRNSDERYRGRIMGIRMMAIYGNLPGLLLAGPLIAGFGYTATATGYCLFGIVFAVLIALTWRRHLWQSGAAANLR